MKRPIFIILWTAGFAALALIIGCLGFALLGFVGMATWKEATVVLVGRGWSAIAFGVPVVGLLLGLLGKLPGTGRIKSQGANLA